MKKALVTIAIGEKFEKIEDNYSKSRVDYANKHGFEYIVYRTMPDDWLKIKEKTPKGRQANLFKLVLPSLQQDYDFVAFIDSDTFINPFAPCLSELEPFIPKTGFAACMSHTYEERHRYFPNWPRTYYKGLEERDNITLPPIRDPKIDINGGLMLYRPKEIAERWYDLACQETTLTQENLLCVNDVQEGLCHIMEDVWNRIWYYQKYRTRYLRPVKSEFGRYRNAFINRYTAPFEKQLLKKELRRCYMMHFAFEHHKTLWPYEFPESILTPDL